MSNSKLESSIILSCVNKDVFFDQIRLIIREELERILTKKVELNQSTEKVFIKGIHGLAKFLQVSSVTAQAIKNSGKIPYSQIGRTVLFDGDAVLQAMAEINLTKKGARK